MQQLDALRLSVTKGPNLGEADATKSWIGSQWGEDIHASAPSSNMNSQFEMKDKKKLISSNFLEILDGAFTYYKS